MPLESCMILLDCSQYMRNGDYIPTRLEAQLDAANLLIGAKTHSHPESTVGVSAGSNLLVSPTDDVGKIMNAVRRVQLAATDASDIPTAVSVASLALKHRRNKNGAQRIVLFVGTPVSADVKALQKAGRLLKKNNVAIDVVALGELEHNEAILQELVDAANGRSSSSSSAANNNTGEDAAAGTTVDPERTCHLVSVPAGVLPSDVLASSPILAAGAFAAAAAGFGAPHHRGGSNNNNTNNGAGGGGTSNDDGFDFGGVDPNMDPELAMALRVSMEEERARQERVAAAAAAAEASSEATTTTGADAEMADASAAAADAAGFSEEEALLQQALAMSMNENDPEDSTTPATAKTSNGDDDEDMEDDDEAMQMALQMSLATEVDAPNSNNNQEFQDPAFIQQMLQSMPGVDPNDPEIQEMLKKAAEEHQKKKEEEK